MDGIVGTHGSVQRPPAAPARVQVLVEFFARLQRAQRMARVRREMHALSDHHLRDIGLSRHEIDHTFR